MNMKDVFRPRHEPAKTIYDAFQLEASERSGRTVADWQDAEKQAVWRAARDYAQQHGLRIPTIADVEHADLLAAGHTDYGAKLAYGVAQCMSEQRKVIGAG